MIYQNLEFHNVDHLEPVSGLEGMRLERFPNALKNRLGIPENSNARFRAQRVHGCEIRFVTEAVYFDVCLTALEADIDAVIYYGDMVHAKYTLRAGLRTVLHVEYPEQYKQVEADRLPKGRFAPNVWRIQLGMNGYLLFHYLDTYGFECRPPQKGEKPETLWAAYGSSITCGSVTALYSNCYLEQTARRLGYDVLNKGLSGSCMCEPETARYLAELPVSVLTLELGVNMLIPFDETSFEERIRTFLQIVKEHSHAEEIYVIDIFANRGPILRDHSSHQYCHYDSFRKIVKQAVGQAGDDRMKWIDGQKIAGDCTYLSTDLLHPSDDGHIRMGENLAKAIQEKKEGHRG